MNGAVGKLALIGLGASDLGKKKPNPMGAGPDVRERVAGKDKATISGKANIDRLRQSLQRRKPRLHPAKSVGEILPKDQGLKRIHA